MTDLTAPFDRRQMLALAAIGGAAAALPASAIYVSIFNAAIGGGALAGAIVLAVSNINGLMAIAAIAIAGSLVPVILIKAPHN